MTVMLSVFRVLFAGAERVEVLCFLDIFLFSLGVKRHSEIFSSFNS